mgnify:FL=1
MFLEMHNIKKSFSGNQILFGVDMQIKAGTVHGLIGPNGSGKSTIVNILSGLYPPDSGEIYWLGNPLEHFSTYEALKSGIFTLYQEHQLIPQLTIMDNLFLGICEKKWGLFCDKKKMEQRSREVLDYFQCNLSPYLEVGSLTKSEKEVIAAAKALLWRAKLFIMDEPTAGMSQQEQKKVLDLVKRIRDSGASVIYVTHRLEELRQICDEISIMRDGYLVLHSSMDAISDNRILQIMNTVQMNDEKKNLVPSTHKVMEIEHLSLKGIYHNISFSLHQGEILGIAGAIGSGRTALLKTLFGAITPTSGSIKINHKKTVFRDICDAIEHDIGYMPDERLDLGIIPDLSVLDNSMLAKASKRGTFLKNTKKELKNFIQEIVEPGFFIANPNQPIRYASGGNQQKTIFFRWIISEAKILLLDEPTKGIDIASKNEMYQMIFEKARAGVSFIVSSSDYLELKKLCTRILILKDGNLTEYGQLIF